MINLTNLSQLFNIYRGETVSSGHYTTMLYLHNKSTESIAMNTPLQIIDADSDIISIEQHNIENDSTQAYNGKQTLKRKTENINERSLSKKLKSKKDENYYFSTKHWTSKFTNFEINKNRN